MITLSEYLGFIFIEITNARVMADQESARIAELYSKNPLLEKFSVPRFKIPEMELNVPVVISGAKYSSTMIFSEKKENFIAQIQNELAIAVRKMQIKKGKVNIDFSLIKDKDFNILIDPKLIKPQDAKGARKVGVQDAKEDEQIVLFFDALKSNPVPDRPEEIVTLHFARLFNQRFEEKALIKDYKEFYPKNELFLESVAQVLSYVRNKTIVEKNKIDNLLVNPETNIIREEASDLSVFSIKAKITEEGIFVKTIRDKESNKIISADVDFE